jgi:peptide/nickel transport system substrate-binding protein
MSSSSYNEAVGDGCGEAVLMRPRGFLRRTVTAGMVAGSLTLGLVGVAATSSSASQTSHTTCAPGATSALCTINVAWGPGTFAKSIFPFYSGAAFSVSNISDLQDLLYRPLYWYGKGLSIAEQNNLSPGNAPTYALVGGHLKATITIKPGWTFTNHAGAKEQLNAQSVIFFLNMYQAEKHNYGDYTPTYGVPDQILNVTKNNNLSVSITFNSNMSHNWVTLNELSQISPMPVAWDIAATGLPPGSGHCSTDAWNAPTLTADCTAVWTYLNTEDTTYSTYNDLNSLWGWDSGPWRLKHFGLSGGAPDGNQTLIPNTGYNGPVKSHMGQVVFTPFTTTSAEVSAMKAGHIDLGYAPETDVTAAPKPGEAGTNLSSAGLGAFKVEGSTEWGFSYAYVNFGGSTSTHPLPNGVVKSEMNMAYIREALLYGEDQAGIVKHEYKNYGVTATLGLVPVIPKNNFGGTYKYPYTYSISKGKALLAAHGFTNGVCTKAGAIGCGTAAYPIAHGSHINFTYEFSSGDPQFTLAMQAEQAAWASEGIHMTLDAQTANNIINDCFVGGAAWNFCQYGGWIYFPDFYPTAEVLWHTGAGANFGGYTNTEMDRLIDGTTNKGNFTLDATQPTYHTSFLAYSVTQVPYLYQPTELGPAEYNKHLVGALPVSPLADFMPEYITAK